MNLKSRFFLILTLAFASHAFAGEVDLPDDVKAYCDSEFSKAISAKAPATELDNLSVKLNHALFNCEKKIPETNKAAQAKITEFRNACTRIYGQDMIDTDKGIHDQFYRCVAKGVYSMTTGKDLDHPFAKAGGEPSGTAGK